ncbi:hypothetical protein KHA96_22090 [Bacillus sp. FJAT-49711]|uniref:hypothetical protein n=1 Tax=Bacillus sp. FJAT-49711 TaxID=2833585 RepID=UPI001BC8E442|nr:hypothetical protein [Bacillus sp. FJAT-49711]MBS4220988.1 hypothetical protein [Bacillus sp. FJAT-49711]
MDEIRRMTSAEIDTIDISSTPEDFLLEAIRNADVIVTRADFEGKIKRFADPAQKNSHLRWLHK